MLGTDFLVRYGSNYTVIIALLLSFDHVVKNEPFGYRDYPHKAWLLTPLTNPLSEQEQRYNDDPRSGLVSGGTDHRTAERLSALELWIDEHDPPNIEPNAAANLDVINSMCNTNW